MSSSPRVRLDVDGPVAVLTLDRPEARNAFDLRSARELDAALTGVEADTGVRAVVLAAEGPVFCAGADLKAMAAGEAEAFIPDRGWGGLTRRRRTKPIIAAVDGPALAGGLELVLACDLVVAGPKATFGAPEIRWGLIAAAGGAIRLPHRIPPNIANELLLTAKPMAAERAHAVGLVNRLVAEGEALGTATELALEIAANAPLAVEATLQVTEVTIGEGEEPAWRLAMELLERMRTTDDFAEGLAAFADGRPAVWSGR